MPKLLHMRLKSDILNNSQVSKIVFISPLRTLRTANLHDIRCINHSLVERHLWVHISKLNSRMFTPWTTRLAQGLVKFVIGCWTCPETISVYTKEKNVKVTMKFKGLQNTYFKVHIILGGTLRKISKHGVLKYRVYFIHEQ